MANIGLRGLETGVWGILEILARYGAQIVVTIILARLLDPSSFGLIAILLVFTSVGALIADAGFGTALIQRRDVSQDDETTMFCITLVTGFAASLMLFFAANGIASFYNKPELAPLTKLMAWVLFLGAIGAVPDALLTRRLNFNARTHAQVISSLASGIVAIFLALHGLGVWSLAWQGLTETALRTILMWRFSNWLPTGRFRKDSFAALFGFGGYMLIAGIFSTLSTRLQALMIGKLFSANELGYYSIAQNTQQAPSSFLATLLNRTGLPVFSAIAHDSNKLRLALKVTLQVSMFVFFPCMTGLAVVANPTIELIYGEKWTPAAPMLTFLALAASIWPIHVLNLLALSSAGRSDRFLRLELTKNAIVFAATLLASPLGPTAVAASMLAASICATLINTWYSKEVLNYGLSEQISDLKSTLLLTAAALAPAWVVLHWLHKSMLAMLVSIIASITIYVVLATVRRHPAMDEITHMLKLAISSVGKNRNT